MPRQMLPLASVLTRVSRALRRCSGSACRRPLARGHVDQQRRAVIGGSPSSARRARSRSRSGDGGTSPRVSWASSSMVRPCGQQRTADPIRAGQHRLAHEVGPQLVELAVGQAAERLGEPGPGGHAAVDGVGGEVVLEHHLGPAHAVDRADRVVGVRDHQEREVGRTEVRRQPQPHVRIAVVGHGARRDEAELGDRLVELRVAHRGQGGEHCPRVWSHVGRHAPTSWASSWAAGFASPCSWYSAGTSMP